jgi:hypothetical protein
MEDILAFRKMITPMIIQVLFWIGVVLCVLMGLGMLLRGGVASVLGLVWIFVGPIVWRVNCELIIVLFTINNTLTDIHNDLKAKAEGGSGSSL